jgi:hypothetical protein
MGIIRGEGASGASATKGDLITDVGWFSLDR